MEMEQAEEEPVEAGIQHVQILNPNEVISQGETITLSLENAAQLILQQHGLQGDEEGRLQPGTYQIITQQLGSAGDGQMQVALPNSISVIQADGSDLSAFGLGGQGIILQAGNVDPETDGDTMLQVADQTEVEDQTTLQASFSVSDTELLTNSDLQQSKEELDGQSEDGLQIDLPTTSQSESMLLPTTSQSESMLLTTTSQSESMLLPTTSQSESMLLPTTSQSESMLQVINHPLPGVTSVSGLDADTDGILDSTKDGYTVCFLEPQKFTMKEDGEECEEEVDVESDDKAESGTAGDDGPAQQHLAYTADIKQEHVEIEQHTAADAPDGTQMVLMDGDQLEPLEEPNTTASPTIIEEEVPEPVSSVKKAAVKPEKPPKLPDLSKPIAVTDHMEVVVGGKKCLLKVNPETGQLCAYPLISANQPAKKRGRPKRSEMLAKAAEEANALEDALTEKHSAKEHEQANSAAEGLLELSNTGPDGIRRSGRARRKAKTLDDYDMIEVSSDDEGAADEVEDEVLPSGAIRKRKVGSRKDFLPASPVPLPGVKRGRGRPRRYPRPDETATSSQIPAMIIPSGDGQTIMMAPIQGLTNLEAFQEQVKNLSIFQQMKSEMTDEASQYLNTGSSILSLDDGTQINIQLGSASDQKLSEDVDPSDTKLSLITEQVDTDTEGGDLSEGSSSLIQAGLSQADAVTALNSDPSLKSESQSDEGQATIIQIPENLLPMFMQKKDPVKLGLKASDSHLEKWRCVKCDHQSYYDQQHQSHLLTHPEDTIKCKCCAYVTFDREDLLNHFKVTHPRCICSVCDHMAEHAYIIKRHMMRHTQDGCRCDICGKVYKDQYVLKMHVKMVHLPAEVLFECTICTKKFTRKAHLKRHLRIHDPQKPFKCPHCQYRGCERSDISKHLLIHEDPKHTCEVCGKTFRHIKNKELHLKRHTGQRDYKCGVCDFYGYTFTDIRKHIERKHSDAKTYLCDKCGAAFKNEQLLREHRSQQCEVFMIEQALSIATSDGGTSQATIQIPSSLSALEGQPLQIDGQNISIDSQGHITVEHVNLSEDGIGLSEDQLQGGVVQGAITDTELQSVVNQDTISDIGQNQEQIITDIGTNPGQIITDIGQTQAQIITDIGQGQGEIIQGIGGEDDVNLSEEEENEEDMEDMDEDDVDMAGGLQGMDVDKQQLVNVNDHMLGMVHIMR